MASPTMSSYPGGFAAGIIIRGIPLVQTHPGNVFWVYNGTALRQGQKTGSDANKGTFDAPFATISYAISQCVANRGDIIFVKPGHAESIIAANGINFNIAGVAIIGLGVGSNRPTLTWSTVAGANIQVSANNVTLSNFLCISTMATGFTTSAFAILTTVVANDFTIDNCEFRDSSATTGFLAIVTQGGTTANALDGFVFSNNRYVHTMTTITNVTAAVVMTAAHYRQIYDNNFIAQTTANNNVALLVAFGANSQTALQISRNRTYSNNTGTTAGELFSGGSTASNGLVSDNYSWHLAGTGLLGPVSTKLAFAQNYCNITGAADKQPVANPLLV